MINTLPVSFLLEEGDLVIILPIAIVLVFFIIYWFTAQSPSIRELFYRKSDFDKASVQHFLFNKIFGFIAMGAIPLVICVIIFPDYSLAFYGVAWKSETIIFTLICTAILSLVVIPVAMVSARKPENHINYPQIRAKVWTIKTIIINIAGWAIYLLGYEILFRGILLMPLANHLGVWPAIIINIALYSSTHIPKGLSEAIGAIPLGLIFCILTLLSGTIWIAFFVHLAMALTNCFTAFKFHPDIIYKRRM